MDGINATPALQPDTEEFIEVPHNMTEINAEDESPFHMAASTETIESWLQEFIDSDIGLDESKNIESFQLSKQDGGVTQTLGDVTYQLDESFSTNLIFLCNARIDELDERPHELVAEEGGIKGELAERKANGSENLPNPDCGQILAVATLADASDAPPRSRSRYPCPHCHKEFSHLGDMKVSDHPPIIYMY
jgi:hypothetical protein